MKLTTEQEAQIQLLSDGEIYRRAINFANEPPQQEVLVYRSFSSQINGLLQSSRSWGELIDFVKHQKERNWQQQKQSYEEFYTALEARLNKIFTDVKETYHLVSNDLSKTEAREQQSFFAGLLAREFIQHLYAEMLYRKGGPA
jgi:hypothetical protein